LAGGYETVSGWDGKGFPTVYTYPQGYTTMPKSYNEQGFLIPPTPAPAPASTLSTAAIAQKAAADSSASASPTPLKGAASAVGSRFAKETFAFSLILSVLMLV
jgi:hypothetical protein